MKTKYQKPTGILQGDTHDCQHDALLEYDSVDEISHECGVDDGLEELVNDHLLMKIDAYELEFYPGAIMCPDCGHELFTVVFDNRPLLFTLPITDGANRLVEDFIEGIVRDQQWQEMQDTSKYRHN